MDEPNTVRLSNRVELPLIGIGTSLSDPNEKSKLYSAIQTAISAGYRHIDTAPVYGTEEIIGNALTDLYKANKINRSDVFLTTKLPSYANRPHVARQALEQSLNNLKTNCLDLYLIHSPMSVKPNENMDNQLMDEQGLAIPDDVDLVETWRFMEEACFEGRTRAIGLSNFNAKQVKQIYDAAKIKPHCLQIELHLFLKQKELVDLCRKLEIQVISYGTLGSPGRSLAKPGITSVSCLKHPLVVELSNKYGITPAQVLLRHQIQNGVACIPKSVDTYRIRENLRVLNFSIRKEDCERLNNEVSEEIRIFPCSKLKHHPNYPF